MPRTLLPRLHAFQACHGARFLFASPPWGVRHRPARTLGDPMAFDLFMSVFVAVGVLLGAYLLYAMLNPEKF